MISLETIGFTLASQRQTSMRIIFSSPDVEGSLHGELGPVVVEVPQVEPLERTRAAGPPGRAVVIEVPDAVEAMRRDEVTVVCHENNKRQLKTCPRVNKCRRKF